MSFPQVRMRRLRQSSALRDLVRENQLTVNDFIAPLFITHEQGALSEIKSLPGQHQLGADKVVEYVKPLVEQGVPAVILFGIPAHKDDHGSSGWDPDGPVHRAIKNLRSAYPDLCVITDVCMCEYTDHGHCGVLAGESVQNDETLELLAQEALSHVQAGANMVAPSDMMDGRIGFIRAVLDDEGFDDIPIMAYSAKYASAYYGPFRDAAGSAPQFGDRRGYQMDPANSREALREVALDIDEGADIVMVKPAGPCLDIIRAVSDRHELPLAAYQVSGEYAMIKAAAQNGWLDGERVMLESLLAIKRAGANMILTYFAKEAAHALGT